MKFLIIGRGKTDIKKGELFHNVEGGEAAHEKVFMMIHIGSYAQDAVERDAGLRLCVRLTGPDTGEIVSFRPAKYYTKLQQEGELEVKEV